VRGEGERYRELARVFRALAHPARLCLLEKLEAKECCVGELQECLSLSQPRVSQHLKILKEAGILVSRREKQRICYRAADRNLFRLWNLAPRRKGDTNGKR